MNIDTFKDLYVAELQEIVSMETQLGSALKRMAGVAAHPSLKRVFNEHQQETLAQRERVIALLGKHGASPAHTDQSVERLIHETGKMAALTEDDCLRDAALINSAQKLEHYEIAAYGSAAALAGQLDLREDQAVLHEILMEERQLDQRLTALAKSEVNQDALAVSASK